MLRINNESEIISNSFGMWISALFGNIKAYNQDIDFIEHKKEFFCLLKMLLDAKKIYFEYPESSCGSQIVWEADSNKIIQYLLEHWPKKARDENDLDTYFYEIPVILWVGENGKFYAS